MEVTTLWFVAVSVFVVYAHVVEYATHRCLMHRRRRGWLGREFDAHAIEHHARNRLDFGVDASPLVILSLASPLVVFVGWLGPAWLVFLIAATGVYAWAWSALHRASHDLPCPAAARSRLWNYWREHHNEHHRRPSRNFGTVFPWTDHLFGTKATATADADGAFPNETTPGR